jgi:HK97 gp10 family phage protein
VRSRTRLSGFKELDVALGELPKATGRNVLRRVLVKAGQPLAEDMARRAPRDEGDTAESVTVSTQRPNVSSKAKRRNPKSSSVEVYVGPGKLAQAEQQEHGNVNHPPQPFVRPAWDAGKDAALDTIGRELGGEIERAAKRQAKKRAKAAAKG